MRVEIEEHAGLHNTLAREINKLSGKFSARSYSNIGSVEGILLKKNISVEAKKRALVMELHKGTLHAFSINKKKFSAAMTGALKQRLANLRKIIIKLRSINYYLETAFLADLKRLNPKYSWKDPKAAYQSDLARNDFEVLEYNAYNLIKSAVSLDKKLLGKYGHKAKAVTMKEASELNDITALLRKESIMLEHFEAKLPPPKMIEASLIKEPSFTHWSSRVFALLLYFEWLYGKESVVFSNLKKNRLIKSKIDKKITHLINEKSRLIIIMQEKAASIRSFRMENGIKRELHSFTAAINL